MIIKGNIQVGYVSSTTSYLIDTGTANTYAVTIDPAIAVYTTGLMVVFKATNANTGTSTLNVNGLGAKTLKKNVSTNLASGDILAGQIVTVYYDGTNFQMASSAGTGGGSGTSGVSGTSGTSGVNGTSGINGTSGTSGVNGSNGTSGVNGSNGSSGTSGVSGTSGTSSAGALSGTGTANKVAKYSASATLTSSNIDDNGSRVQFAKQYGSTKNTITYSSTVAVDWSSSNVQEITLTGTWTPSAFNNGVAGFRYLLKVAQDATGSRTVNWPAGIKWSGGVAPTSSGANKVDIYSFMYDGTYYYGGVNANF